MLLAGMLSTAVSATIGATTLALGGLAAWSDYGRIWLTCWLGDGAVWTAFRFGQTETAVSILILLWIATWGTLRETGPFATAAPFARLLILQAFMGTVAAMVMSIAALVANQRRLLAAEHQAREAAEAATGRRTTFWRSSVTSFAIRWRRSPRPCTSSTGSQRGRGRETEQA